MQKRIWTWRLYCTEPVKDSFLTYPCMEKIAINHAPSAYMETNNSITHKSQTKLKKKVSSLEASSIPAQSTKMMSIVSAINGAIKNTVKAISAGNESDSDEIQFVEPQLAVAQAKKKKTNANAAILNAKHNRKSARYDSEDEDEVEIVGLTTMMSNASHINFKIAYVKLRKVCAAINLGLFYPAVKARLENDDGSEEFRAFVHEINMAITKMESRWNFARDAFNSMARNITNMESTTIININASKLVSAINAFEESASLLRSRYVDVSALRREQYLVCADKAGDEDYESDDEPEFPDPTYPFIAVTLLKVPQSPPTNEDEVVLDAATRAHMEGNPKQPLMEIEDEQNLTDDEVAKAKDHISDYENQTTPECEIPGKQTAYSYGEPTSRGIPVYDLSDLDSYERERFPKLSDEIKRFVLYIGNKLMPYVFKNWKDPEEHDNKSEHLHDYLGNVRNNLYFRADPDVGIDNISFPDLIAHATQRGVYRICHDDGAKFLREIATKDKFNCVPGAQEFLQFLIDGKRFFQRNELESHSESERESDDEEEETKSEPAVETKSTATSKLVGYLKTTIIPLLEADKIGKSAKVLATEMKKWLEILEPNMTVEHYNYASVAAFPEDKLEFYEQFISDFDKILGQTFERDDGVVDGAGELADIEKAILGKIAICKSELRMKAAFAKKQAPDAPKKAPASSTTHMDESDSDEDDAQLSPAYGDAEPVPAPDFDSKSETDDSEQRNNEEMAHSAQPNSQSSSDSAAAPTRPRRQAAIVATEKTKEITTRKRAAASPKKETAPKRAKAAPKPSPKKPTKAPVKAPTHSADGVPLRRSARFA